uniref:Uncharacterized protein n=1 Tax=Lepeophtheirus salmonis TaxID=72036 RepID=A0A0K2U2P7_LEPSM
MKRSRLLHIRIYIARSII